MTSAEVIPSQSSFTYSRGPWHLSAEQVRSFDEEGYLILRKRIEPDLLKRLQAAGDRWIADGLRAEAEVNRDQRVGDYAFANRENGKILFRVNYLHSKGEAASLELLGSPSVLGVAESLCGRNFVPTYESMVFKMPGDGEIIPWHQDAVFPRQFRVFNFDCYLDSSKAGAGALHVIPGSHRQTHDVCKVAEEYGWNHPDMITVEMEPGDVLVHDDMVLHGSPHVQGNALRRTIYFEFRSVEQILTEGPFDQDFIDNRLRLIPLALRRFEQSNPGAPQFRWNVDAAYRPAAIQDEATELRVVHSVHTPGSYCAASKPAAGMGGTR